MVKTPCNVKLIKEQRNGAVYRGSFHEDVLPVPPDAAARVKKLNKKLKWHHLHAVLTGWLA